jgi:AcrR family transcriptional regulator
MARTVDIEAQTIRREAFVDAAQRLIQQQGWEQSSIQDVLDEAGTSRGAFYHYFDSKAALLEAVVERMVDGGIARIGPNVSQPGLPALEKFHALFGDIAQYKAEHKELILGFLRVWVSDENAVVREHFRRSMVRRLHPLLTVIVHQGVVEGSFTVHSPEATARVVISTLQGLNEDITDLFFRLDAGEVELSDLTGRLVAYEEAFERILGCAPGTIRLTDESVLRDWYGWQQDYKRGVP